MTQMHNLICQDCGFDFGALKDRLPLTLGKGTNACRVDVDERGHAVGNGLRCPACGEHVPLLVAKLGVIVRGTGAGAKFARWKTGAPSAKLVIQHRTMNDSELEIGLDGLEDLEVRSACFERVPVFRTATGKLQAPSSPVRREFFDCVDEGRTRAYVARGEALAEIVGQQCVYTLFLHGIEEPQKVSIRLAGPTAGEIDAENAYSEINVRVWPNVPLTSWRHFLVGIAGAGERGNQLVADQKLAVFCRSSIGGDWAKLETQRAGSARAASSSGRPRWVLLEWRDAGGSALTGGAFLVPEPHLTDAAGEARFGLDFGTSNTCIGAIGDMSESTEEGRVIGPVDETEFNQYLLRGGREIIGAAGPDLWPCPDGFGPTKDVVASELLFNTKVKENVARLTSIDTWSFGIDYGLSSPGVPTFPEGDYLVRHFKWRELLRKSGGAYVDNIDKLQARYWFAVLMQAYVRAGLRSRQWAKRIQVYYSFPMAFDEADLKALDDAAVHARQWLINATGIDWAIERGPDESTSAAAIAGDPRANVLVYLDMGGGSTDIAIKVRSDDGPSRTVFLTSVAYAGSAVLEGLAGREPALSCLSRNESLDSLHRHVRELKGGTNDLLANESLFKKAWRDTISHRIRHFYGYLTEYVARLLAAGILDRRFARPQEGDLPRYGQNFELHVCFYFLGNGWGFASHTTEADPLKAMCGRVMDRMMELVEAEPLPWAEEVRGELGNADVKDEIGKLPPNAVPHPKAAVAIGLLTGRAQTMARDTTTDSRRRGALCVTTTPGTGAPIPWFAYYNTAEVGPPRHAIGSGGENPNVTRRAFGAKTRAADSNPAWYKEKIPASARLEWEPPEPKWPEDLVPPTKLDPGLNQTRGDLHRACDVRANEGWFPRGPYEILLERLFKPKIGELTP